jgi:RHS repeat-associated protein
VYYYHLDQLNTPRFVTNQAAEVVWENTANSYGYEDKTSEKQKGREGHKSDFYQPIRFQGQYFDQESGFHYNRFRYYCPKQQRFIHQDPIGIVGGINHYQYAPNPVNWVDPMGLLCKEGVKKLSAMLSAAGADSQLIIDVLNEIENNDVVAFDPTSSVHIIKDKSVSCVTVNIGGLNDIAGQITLVDQLNDKDIVISTEDFLASFKMGERFLTIQAAPDGTIKSSYYPEPLDDPKIEKETLRNENAVNGYSLKPSSPLAKFEIDFTDPESVEKVKKRRMEYHADLNVKRKKLEKEINERLDSGESYENIARDKVSQRNQSRRESYLKNDDMKGLKSMEQRNLKQYGNIYGPTPESLLKKNKTWRQVIMSSTRTSGTMDALTGIYGEY